MTVKCDQCKKEGTFDISLQFTSSNSICNECYHSSPFDWRYSFCNLKCFFGWLKEKQIEEKGFPCQDCIDLNGESTGWSGGFKQNGICSTCNGTKRVAARVFFNNKHEVIDCPWPIVQ